MNDKLFALPSLLKSLIVIGITIIALIFIKQYLIKKVAYRSRKENLNTVDGLIFNLLQYVVIIVAIFVILTVNGIKVSGLLASLGIAATVVGLSLQDTFKDLFAGINIYNNNFYKVGDFVRYNSEICEVKFFNARITKFRSVATGSTYTVSNSSISSIEKIKKNLALFFIFDFDVDKELIDDSLNEVVKAIKKSKIAEDVVNYSLINISAEGCKYLVAASANPAKHFSVKLIAYDIAYKEFRKRGIAPQFDSDRDIVITDKHKSQYVLTKKKKK